MTTTKSVQIIRANKASSNERLRVAAYCRVSTDSDDQINSFMVQMHYYYSFIQQSEDMELVDIYADEGITGTCTDKRDDFNRMIGDCKAGKIDRIYVKSVQRFARNSLDCLDTIHQLKNYNVSVYFENDGIDTENMNSELILYVKSAFAQEEAMSGSRRVHTANRMRAENGHYVFTNAPFGYAMKDNELIIIPEEAEVIRYIFDRYLHGVGMSKLTVALNTDPNIIGKPWKKEHIKYVLGNEKYIGDSLYQKTYTPHQLPFRNRVNKGEADQYYITNTHEAIVDKETFNAVQEMLKRNQERHNKKRKPRKYNFTDKIQCGDCGWAYKRRVQHEIVYWVCTKTGVSGCQCKTKPISEEALCKTFVNFYNRFRLHENRILRNAITRLNEIKRMVSHSDSEIADIDKRIGELVQQNSMYQMLIEQGMMDEITYAESTGKVERQLAKLRDQRKIILSKDDDERSIDEIRQLRNMLETAPPAILTFDQKLFDMMVKKVIVEEDGKLTFELKSGIRLREAIAWN